MDETREVGAGGARAPSVQKKPWSVPECRALAARNTTFSYTGTTNDGSSYYSSAAPTTSGSYYSPR